jgi:amino acid transporter
MYSTKQGGVFRWVGEAFGTRLGFLAIWLQWIQSTIWYPTVLTFGAVSIAFIGLDMSADAALASNRVFTLVVVLVIYWAATFIALRGIGWVGKVSKWGGVIGTIIPAILLILLAIVYLAGGGVSHLNTQESFFPDLSNFNNLVLASSIFLFYAGMEMMGVHVMEVDNPKRNYPRAIIIGSLITVLIFILGTFSLGIVVPADEISLTQTLLIGFDNYFHFLRVSWMGPIVAIALVFVFILTTSLAVAQRTAYESSSEAVIVCNNIISVHASPDNTSKVIRQPSQGVSVYIIRTHGDWTEIEFVDGEKGWIPSKSVERV